MVAVEVQEKRISLIPEQERLLSDYRSPILAAIAGTGSGKTMTGYWWLHSRMEAMPGNTWLVAEPTFPMLAKVLLTSSDPDRPSLVDYLVKVGHQPEYKAVDRIIKTLNGQVYLSSADDPNSMQGAPVKGVWLDEAGLDVVQAYDVARQRCVMLQGQVLITSTPYNLGWLKTEVAEKVGPDIHVEKWRSIDRPGFPRESYERERALLPEWRFRMLYDAKFERPAGVIYSVFYEAACVIPRFEIPKQWLVHTGHDFGASNPAALFYAQDPATGEFYLFDEYLPGPGRGTYDHVQEFKRKTHGYTVVNRIGGSHQEEEIRQGYSAQGWPIFEPRIRLVEEQITRVIGLHQTNRIKVFSDMRNYLDEKRSFSRKLDDSGQVTEQIDNEASYHLMSAERYLMSYFVPEMATGRKWETSKTNRF